MTAGAGGHGEGQMPQGTRGRREKLAGKAFESGGLGGCGESGRYENGAAVRIDLFHTPVRTAYHEGLAPSYGEGRLQSY